MIADRLMKGGLFLVWVFLFFLLASIVVNVFKDFGAIWGTLSFVAFSGVSMITASIAIEEFF